MKELQIKSFLWLAVFITGLLVFRLCQSFIQPIFFDEAFTLYRVRQIELSIPLDVNASKHIAYYYLIYWLQLVCGPSLFLLRIISTIAAVLTVPVIYQIGVRLKNKATGLLAACFMSLSTVAIRSERSYPILILAFCLFALLDLRKVDLQVRIGRKKFLIIYLVSALASCCLHYTGALFVFVHLACRAVFSLSKSCCYFYYKVITLILLLSSPLFFYMYTCFKGQTGFTFLKPVYPNEFLQILQSTLIAKEYIVCVAIYILCSIAIVRAMISKQRIAFHVGFYLLILSILPLLVMYLFQIFFYPIFINRYLLLSAPALALFLGLLIQNTSKTKNSLCLLLFLFSMILLFDSIYKRHAFQGDEYQKSSSLLMHVDFILNNSPNRQIPIYTYNYNIIKFFFYAPLMLSGYQGKYVDQLDVEIDCSTKIQNLWYISSEQSPKNPCGLPSRIVKKFRYAGKSTVLFETLKSNVIN